MWKTSKSFVQLLEELPTEKRDLPYVLYMDNLFTNPRLFQFMKLYGYDTVGNFRENCIPSDCQFHKKTRGAYKSCVEKNAGLVTTLQLLCSRQNMAYKE